MELTVLHGVIGKVCGTAEGSTHSATRKRGTASSCNTALPSAMLDSANGCTEGRKTQNSE
jgi:hypothetical protein